MRCLRPNETLQAELMTSAAAAAAARATAAWRLFQGEADIKAPWGSKCKGASGNRGGSHERGGKRVKSVGKKAAKRVYMSYKHIFIIRYIYINIIYDDNFW